MITFVNAFCFVSKCDKKHNLLFKFEICLFFFFEMSKFYCFVICTVDRYVPGKLRPVWEHPAGPQHIHFWAPLCKWGLVFAGIGDLHRPVDKLSTSQSASLALTGTLWSRWAMIITPKNWSLFAVNFFVALSGMYQLSRCMRYHWEQEEKEHHEENKRGKKKKKQSS